MITESGLKSQLVKEARKIGAFGRRIEDQFAVGILDIIIAFDDLPVIFVEGKLVKSWAIEPTERQWIEGERINKLSGGHALALLVGWDQRGLMFVSKWCKFKSLEKCFQQSADNNYAETLQEFARECCKA